MKNKRESPARKQQMVNAIDKLLLKLHGTHFGYRILRDHFVYTRPNDKSYYITIGVEYIPTWTEGDMILRIKIHLKRYLGLSEAQVSVTAFEVTEQHNAEYLESLKTSLVGDPKFIIPTRFNQTPPEPLQEQEDPAAPIKRRLKIMERLIQGCMGQVFTNKTIKGYYIINVNDKYHVGLAMELVNDTRKWNDQLSSELLIRLFKQFVGDIGVEYMWYYNQHEGDRRHFIRYIEDMETKGNLAVYHIPEQPQDLQEQQKGETPQQVQKRLRLIDKLLTNMRGQVFGNRTIEDHRMYKKANDFYMIIIMTKEVDGDENIERRFLGNAVAGTLKRFAGLPDPSIMYFDGDFPSDRLRFYAHVKNMKKHNMDIITLNKP